MPDNDQTVRVEYVVQCRRFETRGVTHVSEARITAQAIDKDVNTTCGPHRVIKRTITEEDVTDAE